MRSIALIAVLSLVGVATAEPRPHRLHKRTSHSSARAHKRARLHRSLPPPSSAQADPLEPQLQISAPRASVEVAPEPPRRAALVTPAREAPPPSPQEAPPPAQLDTPPSPTVVVHVDLAPHDRDAPPPAMLAGTPAPPPPSPSALHRKRRWGLFGGGLAMFLIGYGADIGLTYGLNHQPATNSLIPFAGPILQTRESWALLPPANSGNPQVDVPANQRISAVNAQIQTGAYVALAVDCAVQLVGTTLVIAGVVGKAPTKYAAIEPAGGGMRVRF
jgi:hypothetical protein